MALILQAGHPLVLSLLVHPQPQFSLRLTRHHQHTSQVQPSQLHRAFPRQPPLFQLLRPLLLPHPSLLLLRHSQLLAITPLHQGTHHHSTILLALVSLLLPTLIIILQPQRFLHQPSQLQRHFLAQAILHLHFLRQHQHSSLQRLLTMYQHRAICLRQHLHDPTFSLVLSLFRLTSFNQPHRPSRATLKLPPSQRLQAILEGQRPRSL